MENRDLLEKLTQSFNREDLSNFFFQASTKFKREKADYGHYIENAVFVKDLQKLGRIDFDDSRRLIVLVGEVDKELTSHSGKLKQYEVAKRVLGNEFDAGIFVFHDDTGHFRFSLVTIGYRDGKKVPSNFRRYTYFISHELPAHTFITEIGKADFSSIEKITEAFSVEPVTKEFFREYRIIFEKAEKSITLDWNAEQKRLYTQRFFNRLMFIAFLEHKDWLKFNGRTDYLKALFEDYVRNDPDKRRSANFHRKRLDTLFFMGLNNEYGRNLLQSDPKYKIIRDQIGEVPFLNGGLFEREKNEEEGTERWLFPDPIVADILDKLVYRFNFTVTESTPLDVEVAVDPEMLGRIFEELVTGRPIARAKIGHCLRSQTRDMFMKRKAGTSPASKWWMCSGRIRPLRWKWKSDVIASRTLAKQSPCNRRLLRTKNKSVLAMTRELK